MLHQTRNPHWQILDSIVLSSTWMLAYQNACLYLNTCHFLHAAPACGAPPNLCHRIPLYHIRIGGKTTRLDVFWFVLKWWVAMQTCMWARVVYVRHQYDCFSPKRKQHHTWQQPCPQTLSESSVSKFFHHSIRFVTVPKFDYSVLFQQLHQLRRVIFGRAVRLDNLGRFSEPWQHSLKHHHYCLKPYSHGS